jgi:hypothetical protein
MNSVSQTTGSNNVYGVDGLTGATGLSPEALLQYCQSQLGGLDTEIKNSIKQQKLELQEREATETAQGVLEQFGDNGPTDGQGMQQCVAALDQAIASLPHGDPVAAQLSDFEQKMISKYGYQAEGTTGTTPTVGFVELVQAVGATVGAQSGSATGTGPTMSNKPQNDEWKGTCDALGNIVGGIKSNAEIQMLSLQDLVSQRQQAVSLACNMMSKEDTSLEQLARLGQG